MKNEETTTAGEWTQEILINGATVYLDWDYMIATHTVPSEDLDQGVADGPWDGQVFEVDGRRYELGAHDYETEDGETTCSAHIYPVDED